MDPFTLRDDACWECIVDELEFAHPDIAKRLRDALQEPLREQALRTLDQPHPGDRLLIEMAARACQRRFRCHEYPD
jgi:hypothetical protein